MMTQRVPIDHDEMIIGSPLDGWVVALGDIRDPVFAERMTARH